MLLRISSPSVQNRSACRVMLSAASLAAIQPTIGPKNVYCILKCNESVHLRNCETKLRGYGKVKLCNFLLRFPLLLSAFKSSPKVTDCLLTQTVLKKKNSFTSSKDRKKAACCFISRCLHDYLEIPPDQIWLKSI
jgi:hypothetical protein